MNTFANRRSTNRRAPNLLGLSGNSYRNQQIHAPPDPSLKSLVGDQREFWDSVRQSALDYYSSNGAPDPKDVAARTAWRAILARAGLQNTWQTTASGRFTPAIIPLQKPRPLSNRHMNQTVELGKIIEYTWINLQDGSLVVSRWNRKYPPGLHWHIDTRTLVVYPNVEDDSGCQPIDPDMDEESEMFEKWALRRPTCQSDFEPGFMMAQPIGVADSVAYISDKFGSRNENPYKEGSQEYFHQHSDGPWIYQDRHRDPGIVAIRGGMLDVEPRGIIH